MKAFDTKHPDRKPVRFNIEIKVPDQPNIDLWNRSAEVMLHAINEAGMKSRTTVQSFEMGVLLAVRQRDADITMSALFEPSGMDIFMSLFGGSQNGDMIIEMTKSIGAQIVSPHELLVTPDFVAFAHERKIKVIPWTVNEEARMKELLKDGVDGLISDYPDRLSLFMNLEK